MARNETITIVSDLTGTESVYVKGSDPAPVNITVHGSKGTVDLTESERDALVKFATTGDVSDLAAIILAAHPATAPAAKTPAKSKSKSDVSATVADAARTWLKANGHTDPAKSREWAVGHGFPALAGGKGRLPGDATVAYAESLGFVKPAVPAPAPASEPADAAATAPEPANA